MAKKKAKKRKYPANLKPAGLPVVVVQPEVLILPVPIEKTRESFFQRVIDWLSR
jgi:hypothetical protein